MNKTNHNQGRLINIEIKARLARPEKFRRLALLSAERCEKFSQRDIYFLTKRGHLKLWTSFSAGAELIFYERPENEAVRTSAYYRLPIAQPEKQKFFGFCLD